MVEDTYEAERAGSCAGASGTASQADSAPAAVLGAGPAEESAVDDGAAPLKEAPENTAAEMLAAAEAQAADYKDRLLRTLAEIENLRKRTEREKADAQRYANASMARDLLAVADNLQRALASAPEKARQDDAAQAFVTGVEMTLQTLLSAFERQGIRCVDPQGEKLDPNFHEAMMEQESADVPAGAVLQVLEPGYVLNGRLLRPARVVVARPPADAKIDTHA